MVTIFARIVFLFAGIFATQVTWAQVERFVGAWQVEGGVPNRQRGMVISREGDSLRVRFGLMQPEPKLGPAEATLASDGTLTIKSGSGTVVVFTVADDHTLVGHLALPNGRESVARATRMSEEMAATVTSAQLAPVAAVRSAPPPASASNMVVASAPADPFRADLPTVRVGDRWKYESYDRRTGSKESVTVRQVTAVSASQIEGTQNNGKFVATTELNTLETSTVVQSGDVKYLTFPLEVGKKWNFKYNVLNKATGGTARWQLDATVIAYEKVKVPAGEFDTFKIEYRGFFNNDSTGKNGRLLITNWYAPAIRNVVKKEFDDTYYRDVSELTEFEIQP